jgi:hypothetical protein
MWRAVSQKRERFEDLRQIALAVAWRQAVAHWNLWHWKAAERPLVPTVPRSHYIVRQDDGCRRRQ